MEFEFDDQDLTFSIDYSVTQKQSAFDLLLKKQWTEAAESGVCRYQLPDLNTAVLPGKYGFVIQINSRRPEMKRKPQDFRAVISCFNPNQFNFNEIPDKEILMKLKWPESLHSGADENFIVINVSPLEFGNCLLVPFRKACVSQRITLDGLNLLIKTMLLSNDLNFRSGFNSPGASCSVNHQHFHMYYLRQRLFIETAELEHLAGPCFILKDFPSKGFVFLLENKDISLSVKNIFILISYLQQNEISHNLFITRGTSYKYAVDSSYDTLRIFIWPRLSFFGVKDDFGFNPACIELSGHFLMKDTTFYEKATESELARCLTELTASSFKQIISDIPQLYS